MREIIFVTIFLMLMLYIMTKIETKRKKEKLKEENELMFGEICYNRGYLHSVRGQTASFERCIEEINEEIKHGIYNG